MTPAVDPGFFKSTCTIGVELEQDGAAVDSASWTGAAGREWVGLPVETSTLYKATGTWTDCLNNEGGTGTFESSAFSGSEGDLFVFHYDGQQTAFTTLKQRVDFDGGAAVVTFEDGVDVAGLVDVSAEKQDDGTWLLTWDDATPVAEVLAALSTQDGYTRGEPAWIGAPGWW
jgi:hypothetical protein